MAKDHVIKLAQPGYDVKTAGDENLIYSSQWPLLKIYRQDSFTIPNIRTTITVAAHDLAYPPVYWFFANTNIVSWDNLTISQDNRSEFFGPIGDGTLSISSTNLIYTANNFPSAAGSAKLYYYIFALDLTKQYNAPIIRIGDVRAGGRTSHVFKVAKAGKSVDSKNLDDYIIHSRARSPLIHSVNPGVVSEDVGGNSKAFTVYHNLGYVPMFFAYTKNTDGSYTLLPTGSGGSTILKSDEFIVRFQEAVSGRNLTIVVLKDPFVTDYTVQVSV